MSQPITIYVSGESWCPFTQMAWKMEGNKNIEIKKVDCGTCSRLDDTTDLYGSVTKDTCINACDMSFGYPSYIVKSADGRKWNSCAYGFNTEIATTKKIESCLKSYGFLQ